MSDNAAKDWKSCAIWEDSYSAMSTNPLFSFGISLKKQVKDDEERKKSLNKKRKAVTSCSQEGTKGGQKRMSKETDPQSSLLSPITLDSTVDSEDEVLVET
jgi:hypothetical protein